jgi:hypothetical protein
MAVTPTKTIGTSYQAWQDIASAAQVLGSAIDVSTKWLIAFHIMLGRATGSAFTAGWPQVRIEASGKSSGNDAWIPLLTMQMAVGASIVNTTANGAISAGATSCTVTANTNIAVGDYIFLGHTTDVTKYELVRCKSISGTTLTFEEACTNAHDTGCLITDQAEAFFPVLDVSCYSRVRAIIDNANSGQGIKAQVLYNLLDSF